MENNTVTNNKVIITSDDFYDFQIKIRRIIKSLAMDAGKKAILSATRDLTKSPHRQIAYTLEVVDANLVHLIDTETLNNGIAIPVAPNFPEVEEDKDPTL